MLYTKKFQKLLDLEWKEEQARIMEQLKRTKEQLKDDGSALFDLKSETNRQMTGKHLVKFQLFQGKLPYHNFFIGDNVIVSKIEPLKENFKGLIMFVNPYCITCLMDSWNIDFSLKMWRMDRGSSEISRDRMKQALEDLNENPNQRNLHLPKKNHPKGSYLAGIITSQSMDPTKFGEMASEKVGLFVPSKEMMTEWKMNVPLNLSQQIAIERSLNRRLSLILGPPGCGKTTTLIHYIKLCLKIHKGTKIMAAAFTNIAVDNLLEGLIKEGIPALRIGVSDRIGESLQSCTLEAKCAESPIQKKIDEKKSQIEKIQDNGTQMGFKQISALRKEIAELKESMIDSVLKTHDVICCTCVSAGHDLLEGFCFPLVIIDECSQSIEPGTLIPIMKGSHQVVLVGDHNQLHPTVISKEAQEQGLSKSMFERMIDQGLSPYILNIQYRMHPGISAFPSKQFYQNKVFDGIKDSDRPLLKCINWVSKEVPVNFYDVKSEESVAKSNSRYNMRQANMVTEIVNNVLMKGMDPNQVGVISPYAAQVSILRRNCPKVEVKTVDGFQGREKDLIILSTVRSSDSRDPIGFLQDWRRMNVALTRARYGLIVIGDKNTLIKDKNWNEYIQWLEAKKLITNMK